MTEHIRKKIEEADLVLVGLGEELDIVKTVRESSWYQSIASGTKNAWMLPFLEKLGIDKIAEDKCETYKLLGSVLEGKNYFIVSLCQDGIIRNGGLDGTRIVEPCGGYTKLQCGGKCNGELYDIPLELLNKVKAFSEGKRAQEDLEEPVCPNCGKALVFNNISAENYAEEGYLSQWARYKKWLQGTVNKKVCLLEIGVGMKYPTVIRWPFEKITFYNQKAEMFRVHSKLYQMTEEIKERGSGICQKPEEFLKELSKGI